MKHVISLGAGVQSSTMALMAAAGEITPMPDYAIFADTQSEPKRVYRWLEWLKLNLPFPVIVVTAGSLRGEVLAATNGTQRMDARPPFFVRSPKKVGKLRRQCTQDYKIIPIERKLGELIGHKPRSRWPTEPVVTQWIGISMDESHRVKLPRNKWSLHRWPLLELRMTRMECLRWLSAKGFSKPGKSACTFCPFHDDAAWRDMELNDPESFADAVMVDRAIRNGVQRGGKAISKAQWFVHRSCKPLDQIDFRSAEEAGQEVLIGGDPLDEEGFAAECEGMCGV